MFDHVDEAKGALERLSKSFDPDIVSGDDAAALVGVFSTMENMCAALKARAAARAASASAWRRAGERSAAHWLARQSGSSVGQALAVLETAERLAALPAVGDAFRAGALSAAQATEIAAAAVSPEVATELLAAAHVDGLAGLKEKCRSARAASLPDEVERYDAIRRSRSLRKWTDHDGAFRMDLRTTPDAGAAIWTAVEGAASAVFDEARKAGVCEPYDAYMADALVNVCTGTSSAPRANVHVVVDHAALVRGHVESGERCELRGVGPVPVATARSLMGDAIVTALATEDADVRRVARLGRTVPAWLREALEVRDPECVVPGCHVGGHLEIDHYRVAFADGGPLCLDNCARLCRHHHYLRTHKGYLLEGPPGRWRWIVPDATEPPSADELELTASIAELARALRDARAGP